jgi:membrane-bound lytic murein transglycosylase D
VIPSAGNALSDAVTPGAALPRLFFSALVALLCAARALAAEPSSMSSAGAAPDRLAVTSDIPAAAAPLGAADSPLLPRPPELQADVDFWIRVYSAIGTNEGFIHDQRNLAVVYETLHFAPDLPPVARQAQVDAVRLKYQLILAWLASGASPRDAEEQRVRDLWSQTTSIQRLAQAVSEVRFQLGQSDRFRAGLERAGRWEPHIARTMAAAGLPPELSALPHVESSFDPEAYSKVGAAGLWQFMRSTARRYLRVDTQVDERLDPFRATEAAAQLLGYNYRVLGSWPLAITAYNHGAEGVRRARDALGSDDIVRLVREYSAPLFGFASRNFYVSFLAALEVDRHRDRYFAGLRPLPEAHAQEVTLGSAATLAALQRATGNTLDELRPLNPALREPVWSDARPVPAGYRLRLPLGLKTWTSEALAARLAVSGAPVVAATAPRAPSRASSATPAVEQVVDQAVAESREQQRQRSRTETPAGARAGEAVNAAQARSQSPSLLPDAEAALSADATDYSVAADGTIRVASEETLGHYADWLGVPTASLRTLNRLRGGEALRFGQRLRLDFARTSREQFEARRREFHQGVQAAYFAAWRITGSEAYVTRRGDTPYQLAQRGGRIPLWLLQQYNPDVDLLQLRAGLHIVVPRVAPRAEGPPDV